MNAPITPWENPRSYLPNHEDQLGIVEHYENIARQARSKVKAQQIVKAFCIAVAVFAVVYFGGRELIGLVQ